MKGVGWLTPAARKLSTGSSLYGTHVPTTFVQKVMLAGEAAFGALRDPERADLVATLGDTTGTLSLSTMHERMQVDEIGREILQERPVIAESTRIEVLREYPAGTFGKAYADWMEARQYRPEERPEVKYVDDPELAYVMQRYREVHDFVHVLTGLGSTEEEEIAIKWFELLQTGLPVCLLSATVGPTRLTSAQRIRMAAEWVPWAVRCSVQVPFFLNIYFERLFEHDIQELRRELDVAPPPYGVPVQQTA